MVAHYNEKQYTFEIVMANLQLIHLYRNRIGTQFLHTPVISVLWSLWYTPIAHESIKNLSLTFL